MSMKFPIERFRKAATPLCIITTWVAAADLDKIKGSVSRYGFNVHYAMKANANPAILRRISEDGLEPIRSAVEIAAAINAGFKAEDIVFCRRWKNRWRDTAWLREGYRML